MSVERPPRGFFGIGVYHPKREVNIGTLWRHAVLYGADFIYTIGARYTHQPGDTVKAPLCIPLHHYDDLDQFNDHRPWGCPLVAVEMDDSSRPLQTVTHPERAIYLLGAEDHGLPRKVLDLAQVVVEIPSVKPWSMNVATAGTLVMYDRLVKGRRAA